MNDNFAHLWGRFYNMWVNFLQCTPLHVFEVHVSPNFSPIYVKIILSQKGKIQITRGDTQLTYYTNKYSEARLKSHTDNLKNNAERSKARNV